MLALRKPLPRPGLILESIPRPTPASDEVLISLGAAGVCGSDLHVDEWTANYDFMTPALPITIGHELAGTVVEIGASVRQITPGSRVVVVPSASCGSCEQCRGGRSGDCTRRATIGFSRDGAFAEFVAVPAASCIPIASELALEVAALAEPLTIAAQAVRTSALAPGMRALVIGPGSIGQGIAIFARKAGASQVVIAGKDDAFRLSIVRNLGFDDVVDVADAEAALKLPELARGGFDVVFEASGASAAVGQALALTRNGGVIVMTGIYGDRSTIDPTTIVRQSLQLRGSYRASREVWLAVLNMLAQEAPYFARLISHRFPLDRSLEGFSLCHLRRASKVMIVA